MKINIVVSFDFNYLDYAKTMLISLIKNNKKHDIDIYLLYSNLSGEDISGIEKLLKKFSKNVKLIPIYIDMNKYIKYKIKNRFSIEAYYRLLIQTILPKDVEKALWIDSDIIVNGDLQELFSDDFNDNYVIASPDICMINKEKREEVLQRLNLNKNTIYFNSGVLMMNLNLIREEIPQDKYFEYLEKFNNKLKSPDQDILNVVYEGKVKILQNFYGTYNRCVSANGIYSKKEEKILKNNIKIFHYMGAENKPTNFRFNNFMFDEFWKYGKYVYGYKKYLKYKIKNINYKLRNIKKLHKKKEDSLTVQHKELKNEINIVFILNENIEKQIKLINKKLKNINKKVYILYEINDKEQIKILKNNLENKVKKMTINPINVKVNNKEMQNENKEEIYIENIYKILPKKVKRVLYVDKNVIIKKSFKDFYYSDIENNFALALNEKNTKNDLEDCIKFSDFKDKSYLNNKILLIDLVKIRENKEE